MNVINEKAITGATALALRREAKLTQRPFWAAVGVNQASGCRYEKNKSARIPHSVRILLFLVYVVGLDVDAGTPEGVARLFKLAHAAKPARIGEYPQVPYKAV